VLRTGEKILWEQQQKLNSFIQQKKQLEESIEFEKHLGVINKGQLGQIQKDLLILQMIRTKLARTCRLRYFIEKSMELEGSFKSLIHAPELFNIWNLDRSQEDTLNTKIYLVNLRRYLSLVSENEVKHLIQTLLDREVKFESFLSLNSIKMSLHDIHSLMEYLEELKNQPSEINGEMITYNLDKIFDRKRVNYRQFYFLMENLKTFLPENYDNHFNRTRIVSFLEILYNAKHHVYYSPYYNYKDIGRFQDDITFAVWLQDLRNQGINLYQVANDYMISKFPIHKPGLQLRVDWGALRYNPMIPF
jgi:hypothetical protein